MTYVLTALAMIAFAANSLLCRLALKYSAIDAASFTSIRICSGAVVLGTIVAIRRRIKRTRISSESPVPRMVGGNWLSAAALFTYAAAFSFAYLSLSAGTGALLLFGAVQATMILWGMINGERLGRRQSLGLIFAVAGLIALVFPGLSAPPLIGSLLMSTAGIAWGVYSLRGKVADPIAATAGNFLRAVPFAAVLSVFLFARSKFDLTGAGYAVLSGGIASGLGYAIWYSALPHLNAISAASVQLSVPVLAAAGGILLLGESVTSRFLLSSIVILGGIALTVRSRPQRKDIDQTEQMLPAV